MNKTATELDFHQIVDFSLTIVVATVGESTLENLIKSIEEGDLLPVVLILSFPPNSGFERCYSSNKFKIIKLNADNSGQVHQRCYALKYVKTTRVLQVDADIVFHRSTIKILVDSITSLGKGNVVSPLINQHHKTKNFFYQSLESLRCLILDGSFLIKELKITKAGVPYFGDDLVHQQSSLVYVEWLHSVRLYYTEDAVLYNYYPFAGKAYFEDVVQALEFKKRNVKLWAVPLALIEHCPIVDNQEPENDIQIRRAQRWITSSYRFSRFRLEVYYFLILFKRVFMKLLIIRSL